jgi:3-methyladenine DNA glycosylase/8-oxoguanine DNA glycosylase
MQGTVSVQPGAGNALQATVRFPRLHALPAIIARLRRVFDLGSDPVALAAQFSHDPVMAALIAARPGLRVPGAWDGFELAMRAVLGQQITVTAAIRLAGKLVAAHGAPMAQPEDGLTHVFPTPEAVAPAELAVLGMPRSRAATLAAWTTRSSACARYAASANGRRNTSPCAACVNRMRFPAPTSA